MEKPGKGVGTIPQCSEAQADRLGDSSNVFVFPGAIKPSFNAADCGVATNIPMVTVASEHSTVLPVTTDRHQVTAFHAPGTSSFSRPAKFDLVGVGSKYTPEGSSKLCQDITLIDFKTGEEVTITVKTDGRVHDSVFDRVIDILKRG